MRGLDDTTRGTAEYYGRRVGEAQQGGDRNTADLAREGFGRLQVDARRNNISPRAVLGAFTKGLTSARNGD